MVATASPAEAYAVLLRTHVLDGLPIDPSALLEFACELLGAQVAPEDVVGFHRAVYDELLECGQLATRDDVAATNAFFIAIMDAYSSVWHGLREQYGDVPLARAELAAAERMAARLSRGTIATKAAVEVIASRQLIVGGSCYEVRDVGQDRIFAAVGVYNASGVLGAQILALLQYGARALVSAGASLDRLADYLRANLAATFATPPDVDYCAAYMNLLDGTVQAITAGSLVATIVGAERTVLRSAAEPLNRATEVSVQCHTLGEGEALVIAAADCAERWLRPDRGTIRSQIHSLDSSYDFEHQNALVIIK